MALRLPRGCKRKGPPSAAARQPSAAARACAARAASPAAPPDALPPQAPLHDTRSTTHTAAGPSTAAAAAPHPLPEHVAIILDGNHRWAQRRGLPTRFGHRAGVDALRRVVTRCADLGIPALTVFAFSADNWKRSAPEVAALLAIMEASLRSELPELKRAGVRVTFFGDLARLPRSFRELIDRAQAETADEGPFELAVALSYGGQQDIVQATQRLAERVRLGELDAADIDAALLKGQLQSSAAGRGPPDLLIRTSGERRLSNFVLWDLAYAELHFSQALWPDFSVADFDAALEDFSQRTRRFGSR